MTTAETTKEPNSMSQNDTNATTKRSHEAYIREVIAELTERRVATGAVQLAFAPARVALVPITVEVNRQASEDQSALARAQWVMLRWHEAKGWAWQVRYTEDPGPRMAVYFGGSTAPPAADVATWLHRCLLHPEITPVRLATPSAPEDLDEVLHSYDDTTASPLTKPRSAHAAPHGKDVRTAATTAVKNRDQNGQKV